MFIQRDVVTRGIFRPDFVGRIIVGRNVELPAGAENFQDGYDRSSTGLQG